MTGPAFSRPEVLAMERAAARAWPAAEREAIDGWVWRCSGGGGRRANSVLPLAFDGRDLAASIAAVEGRYRAHKLKSYFQVSSIAEPPGLDAALAERSYQFEEPTLLLAKQLLPSSMPDGVVVAVDPDPGWMDIYTTALDATRVAEVPAILARVPAPRAFFTVRLGGEAIATALGVLSPDGIVVVECVATSPGRRRTGAARLVMDALEAWATLQGATVAALQVIESNAPARALYGQRGYCRAGSYHYRWRQV